MSSPGDCVAETYVVSKILQKGKMKKEGRGKIEGVDSQEKIWFKSHFAFALQICFWCEGYMTWDAS